MVNKNSIFYSIENEEEIFERCGLYSQDFDYRLGFFNQDNVIVTDKNYKEAKELKILMYPIWNCHRYINSLHTHVFYLPFFIFICDNVIKLDIDPKYGSK